MSTALIVIVIVGIVLLLIRQLRPRCPYCGSRSCPDRGHVKW